MCSHYFLATKTSLIDDYMITYTICTIGKKNGMDGLHLLLKYEILKININELKVTKESLNSS